MVRLLSFARFSDHGAGTQGQAASGASDGGAPQKGGGTAKEGGAATIGSGRKEEAETGRGKGICRTGRRSVVLVVANLFRSFLYFSKEGDHDLTLHSQHTKMMKHKYQQLQVAKI